MACAFFHSHEREREREREEKSSTQTIFKFVEVKGKCIPKIYYKIELTNNTKKLQNAFNKEMKRAFFSFLFYFILFYLLYFRMSDFYSIEVYWSNPDNFENACPLIYCLSAYLYPNALTPSICTFYYLSNMNVLTNYLLVVL